MCRLLLGAQFTCFTGTKVQDLAQSLSFLGHVEMCRLLLGARFTCFTGTKVQKLTRRMALVELNATIDVVCRGQELETLGSFVVNPKFTYFTSTKLQILTLTRLPGLHAA
jgi:hypothetical protein